jgi:hypothetical protein
MWIDQIEPRGNVYDNSEEDATRVPYSEVNELDLQVRSEVKCPNPMAAWFIGEYLRQFDIRSEVCIDGSTVIYRS